jgi:hypothetical protein
MRRKQNIQDSFKSIVPELSAGKWSVGYSGHTDNSALLAGGTVEITSITNIDDKFVPGTSTLVTNDVYVYYDVMSDDVVASTGKTSIYNYPTTTTTTTAAPTTTTTTTVAATTTTTTAAPTTTTTTTGV